jgi:hypothetical protein
VPKPLKNTAGTSKTHEKRTLKEHASGGPESSTALLLFWFLWPAAGPPNRLRTKMIKTLEMYIVVHFQMIFTSPRLSKYFPQHRQKRAENPPHALTSEPEKHMTKHFGKYCLQHSKLSQKGPNF